MTGHASEVPPPKKQVVKRTSRPPWVPIKSFSPVEPPAPAMLSSQGTSHAGQPPVGNRSIKPQVTGTGNVPSVLPRLGEHHHIKNLQEEWERKQQTSASTGAADRERSGSSSSDIAEVKSVSKKPATSLAQTATPKIIVASNSPVPLPNYALHQKRPLGEMDGIEERSQAKRQNVTGQSPFVQPGKDVTQVRPNTSTLVPNIPAPISTPQRSPPAAHTPVVPPTSTLPSTASAKGRVHQTSTPTQSPRYGTNPSVIMDGKDVPVLEWTGSRRYIFFQDSKGGTYSAHGALIPIHYKVLEGDDAPFICPVRDCQRRMGTLKGLGGHFRANHSRTAFNDNGDGTISKVGPYTHRTWVSTPGVIVSRNPLSPGAPPPVESTGPTLSLKHYSMAFNPYTASPRASPYSSVLLPPSTALSYLDSFLPREQTWSPSRSDILYLITLPRLRDLPKAWIQFHRGHTMEVQLYVASLAYIVGEEVDPQSSERCRRIDVVGASKPTWRLSDRCIRLPRDMPTNARNKFSRFNTCVGCRYWHHIERKSNLCDWNLSGSEPESAPTPAADVNTKPSKAQQHEQSSEEFGDGLGATGADVDTRAEASATPRRLRKRQEISYFPHLKDENPMNGLDLDDDESPRIGGWEFAPGKALDRTKSETTAFSGSYLTSTQPIAISDTVWVHQLHLSTGKTHHWSQNDEVLRTCVVISGKVDFRGEGQTLTLGLGSMFVIRPGKAYTAENRYYGEAVLACHITME